MAVDLLPDAPDPANDTPQAFSQKAAAMVLAQKAMIPQFNQDLAAFNASMAGGAITLPYVYDGVSVDSKPGAGKLRFDSSNSGTLTRIWIDLIGADGADYTSMLDRFDASTSTVKGQLKLVKQNDPTKYWILDVIARTTGAGYRKLTVTNTGGSNSAPFAANDSLLLKFSRTGDKGTVTSIPTLRLRDVKAAGVSAGATSAGVSTRTLNTVLKNSISGASLSGNTITLPSGTYRVRGSAPCTGVGHKASLLQVSTGMTVIEGTSEGAAGTRSILEGEFTAAGAYTYTVQHYAAAAGGTWGSQAGQSGGTEIYTEIVIERIDP